MKRRSISLLLACLLVLGSVPVSVFADEGQPYEKHENPSVQINNFMLQLTQRKGNVWRTIAVND